MKPESSGVHHERKEREKELRNMEEKCALEGVATRKRESKSMEEVCCKGVAIYEKERVKEYVGGVLQKVWQKRESRNMEEMFYRRCGYR